VSVMEEAFEPPTEFSDAKHVEDVLKSGSTTEPIIDPKVLSESTLLLEKRIESMLVDMQELRQQMESFKSRAETAESERDISRKTLAEMVEKIRSDELARQSSSTEREATLVVEDSAMDYAVESDSDSQKAILLEGVKHANGNAKSSIPTKELENLAIDAVSKSQSSREPLLYHTTPYASMLGVVLIGMGLMAYLNGWQPPKVDR